MICYQAKIDEKLEANLKQCCISSNLALLLSVFVTCCAHNACLNRYYHSHVSVSRYIFTLGQCARQVTNAAGCYLRNTTLRLSDERGCCYLTAYELLIPRACSSSARFCCTLVQKQRHTASCAHGWQQNSERRSSSGLPTTSVIVYNRTACSAGLPAQQSFISTQKYLWWLRKSLIRLVT